MAWFWLLFLISLAAVFGFVYLFVAIVRPTHQPLVRAQHQDSFNRLPAPTIQQNPADDLHRYLVQESKLLNEYRWIDRGKGIVSIPIDRAIDLLLAKGLPVRPADSGLTELDIQTQKAGAEPIQPPSAARQQAP
jgi:hypothetical protein